MVIKRDFWYGPGGENRTLHIHLPQQYYESGERYPVMYFFDGHNLFYDYDSTYGKSWGLEDFLNGWDKPMIIVGMECSHHGDDRLSEYSPYGARSGMFSGLQPKGDETMRWIMDEIKPMVDREYRTWGHREATGIAGSSMGGLMALYGVTRYNGVFSKAACISPATGFCQPRMMRTMNDCPVHPDTRVFLSWGTREARGVKDIYALDCSSGTYRRNRAAFNKLEKCGARAKLWCQVGGAHCEADWEKQVPVFMDFLWK